MKNIFTKNLRLFLCISGAIVAVALILQVCGLGMNLGILPGCCLLIFACWLIYSGIAMMLHQATGVQILKYIVAPKSK